MNNGVNESKRRSESQLIKKSRTIICFSNDKQMECKPCSRAIARKPHILIKRDHATRTELKLTLKSKNPNRSIKLNREKSREIQNLSKKSWEMQN